MGGLSPEGESVSASFLPVSAVNMGGEKEGLGEAAVPVRRGLEKVRFIIPFSFHKKLYKLLK